MALSKKIAALLFPFLLVPSLFALSKSDFSLEISPHFGFAYGQLDEYIYSSADDSIKKSLLEWELHPLYTLGLDAKFGWKNLYSSVSSDFALPLECGTMRDSDWNNSGDTKIIYSELEEKNKFSFNSAFELGYDFVFENPLDKKGFKSTFTLSPAASVSYSYFKIESDNGHGYFGGEDYSTNGEEVAWDSEFATYHKVYGINLERQYFNVFAGLRFRADITQKFGISLGMFASPYTYVATFDRHLKKHGSYHLNGYQKGFFEYWKFEFGADYAISKRIKIFLCSDFFYGSVIKGDFYHNYYSSKPQKSRQKSGSGTSVFSARLGWKICTGE